VVREADQSFANVYSTAVSIQNLAGAGAAELDSVNTLASTILSPISRAQSLPDG
jgi:hypothetical protein